MASIRKRNNRWEVRVRRIGQPTQTKTFTLKTDAQKWAREAEIALEKGILLEKPKVSPIMLWQAVKRYLEEVAIHHKGAASERYRLWAMANRLGTSKPITAITSKDIASYKVERQKEVTPASVRRELNLLSSLFETAKNEWGITTLINPLTAVKRPLDSVARDRRLTLTEKEQLLYESLRIGNQKLHLAILIALSTGMRQGEILKLKWDDIDYDRNRITVRDTKNGTNRIIVLSNMLKNKLLNTRQIDDKLFTISASGLQQAFRKLTTRLQIRNLRFHDLRHEAISSFFEMGLSVPEVQLMSGHRTLDQLMRYSHASIERIKQKVG
ncbi:site-specific integrase [Alphaproteobacteria bacterium]|nr:site-specific integrase [Alphaproteobacteria bacterium]